MMRDMDKLEVDNNGLLYRKTSEARQIILPEKFKPLIYSELHIKMGHLGKERVLQLTKGRFYWPKMEDHVNHFITKVCNCVKSKKPNIHHEAPMQTITTSAPLELIGIDFLHLDTCSGGYEYILVITDHFTRFTQAYPTTNKSGKTAAEKLYGDFMMRYGIPEKILSDRGKEFENSLFQRLSKLCGIKKLRTTPYHPQTNGQVERMNQTILSMLRCLPGQQKSNWRHHVNKVVHAYNSTKNSATGYSPYFLLFGRSPRLPIDILIPTENHIQQSHPDYVNKWRDQMQQAYQLAKEKSDKRKRRDIKRHDTTTPPLTTLEKGDRVLVRNLSERGGTGKLRNHWEEKVHKVVSAVGKDKVAYKVIPENVDNPKERIIHRNMLLNCDHLLDHFNWNIDSQDLKDSPENHQQKPKQEKTSSSKTKSHHKEIEREESPESEDSCESDIENFKFTPQQITRLTGEREERGNRQIQERIRHPPNPEESIKNKK